MKNNTTRVAVRILLHLRFFQRLGIRNYPYFVKNRVERRREKEIGTKKRKFIYTKRESDTIIERTSRVKHKLTLYYILLVRFA